MKFQLFGIAILPSDANWLNILSTLAGLLISLASLYGIVVILPNFVKQKRVEHLSDNARSALNVLVDVEESLKKLFFSVKVQANESKQAGLQIEVSLALNKLKNMLLLIVKNAQIPENFIKETHLQQLQELVQLLNEKAQHFPLKLTDILSIIDEDWEKNSKINFSKLDQLRNILVKIHGMNDKNQQHNIFFSDQVVF